jgi:RHS repeat-associated protein
VRDPESGLDQTPNRMLNSGYGRWASPDPLAGDVTNPQSLNRYAYVMNNPATLTDPLGLDSCTLKKPCPPPHPKSCKDMNCAWQYYKGSVDELFNFGGIGGWDQFDVMQIPVTATYYDDGIYQSQVGTGQDLGLQFSDQIAALTYSNGDNSQTSTSDKIISFVRTLLSGVPVAGAFTGSFPIAGPVVGLGPTIPLAYIPSTHQFCGGLGVAVTGPAGKAANFGPVIQGNVSNSAAVLSGFSYSGNVQITPIAGYQAIWNPSGALGGPTFGFPGVSLSATYSGCTKPR